MSILAALRFKLMIAWAYLMRIIFPYSVANRLASKSLPLLHPFLAKQKPAFLHGLNLEFEDGDVVENAWRWHKKFVGVNRLQSSFYAQQDISWINQCQLEIDGAEHIESFHKAGKGILVMTYHHHFNMLFCNLLCKLDHPVTTIAMDDTNSSRYKKFSKRVNRIYDHAEKLSNGGDIILVKPKSMVRSILRAFDKKHLVVTANDFPEVFDDKNRKELPFLNTLLSCPTGTVKLAVKKHIPIVAAYLNWLGDDRFELVIRPVSDGETEIKVKDAMGRYLEVLEFMVQKQPGLWEGWKWMK